MILSIVRGYFKSLFGKKTNTRETWKTGFKPNILEVNLKDLTSKKKKRERKKKHTREKKRKEVEREACLISMIFEEKEMLLH